MLSNVVDDVRTHLEDGLNNVALLDLDFSRVQTDAVNRGQPPSMAVAHHQMPLTAFEPHQRPSSFEHHRQQRSMAFVRTLLKSIVYAPSRSSSVGGLLLLANDRRRLPS